MSRDPSKTEKATPKRLRKAREEGNVAKSQDLTKTATIVAGLIGMTFWISYIGKEMMAIFRHFMTDAFKFQVTDANINNMGIWLAGEIAKMIMPVMFFIAVAAFICLRVQVGKLWTTKVLTPKLSKLNPISGLKRMFLSLKTFVRMGRSLLQALVIGLAPWMVIKDEMGSLLTLYHQDASGVAMYLLSIGLRMTLYALVPMGIISIVDLWYTRWDYAENLTMTRQEVKDEHRQQEGDPQVKNKMKQTMMKMTARRMLQDVPKADVVVTNPTHIAVALRYDPLEAPAPIVVAMGADNLAMKIREIAKENNIPIRENKPLARALYKQTEVGDAIPADLFQAVALILAQIWKTKPPKDRKIGK